MTCQGTCSTCGDLCAGAERAERIAARDALRAEVERLQEKVGQSITHAALDHMAAELNCLRALLSDSTKYELDKEIRWHGSVTDVIRDVLAALRARAGLTDLDAAEVNRGQGDEGAQAQPPGAAVAPTGQAGGEQSGSAGPPAGPYPKATIRAADDPLWANPRSPAGLHPCSKCDCRAFDYEVGEHPGICYCRHSDHDHGMSNGRLAGDRARAGIT